MTPSKSLLRSRSCIIGVFILQQTLFVGCKQSSEKIPATDTSNRVQMLAEELKSPAEYEHFLWFYSAFVFELAYADSIPQLNKYINKDHQLTIIYSTGALPEVKRTLSFADLIAINKFITQDSNLRAEPPQRDRLPVRDCDQPGGWDKSGCYTQEINPLKDSDLWTVAGMREEEIKMTRNAVATITRTVVNTRGVSFYFSLINGTWYLMCIDVRPNCAA